MLKSTFGGRFGHDSMTQLLFDKDIANHHLVDTLADFALTPLQIKERYPLQRLISTAIKALIEF